MAEILSSALLDDIMSLSKDEISHIVRQSSVDDISPVVEFAYYDYGAFNARVKDLPSSAMRESVKRKKPALFLR